jgi:hypothetical protein
VNPGDSEKFSEEPKGRDILESQEIVEGVNEILSFGAEDVVEDLLIVVANDLARLISTQPDDPNPLSLR